MPHSARAFASRPGKTAPTDLLTLLSGGEPPAFANDSDHRIIFWNRGAEELMNRTAAQTLGHLCHEVFGGARDSFGNRFCADTCAVTTSILHRETIRRFEVSAGERRVPQLLGFTIIPYPDTRSGKMIAVHLMDEVRSRPEVARVLERLSAEPISSSRGPAASQAPVVGLSDREREVLRGVASGQSNKEIATALGISVATARNHVQHILQKLDVHSKLEAVALAFREGWVKPRAPEPRTP